jgi:hypothetical protein
MLQSDQARQDPMDEGEPRTGGRAMMRHCLRQCVSGDDMMGRRAMRHSAALDAGLLDRVARALFPGAPSSLLARCCGVAKATARDWRRDRRRAPKPALKQLRELAQIRAAECGVLCRDLDNAIARREGEFHPPQGVYGSS